MNELKRVLDEDAVVGAWMLNLALVWMLRSDVAVVDAEGLMGRGARMFDAVADGGGKRCYLVDVAERWLMRSARVADDVVMGCGLNCVVAVAESWISNVAVDAGKGCGLNDIAVAAVSCMMRSACVAGDAEGGRG